MNQSSGYVQALLFHFLASLSHFCIHLIYILRFINILLPLYYLQAEFNFLRGDYEKQLMRLLTRKEKSGMIINNPAQSMFLFIDKNQLQVSYLKNVLYSSNVWIDRQNKKVLDLLNVFIKNWKAHRMGRGSPYTRTRVKQRRYIYIYIEFHLNHFPRKFSPRPKWKCMYTGSNIHILRPRFLNLNIFKCALKNSSICVERYYKKSF